MGKIKVLFSDDYKMTATIGKIIFISVKILVIGLMMILGLRAHCIKQNRELKVIFLLSFYLLLLALIFVFELVYEYIPIIFLIMICTSASQVFQTELHIDSAKVLVPEGTYKKNKIVIRVFYVIYLLLAAAAFVPGVGARCGRAHMDGINGRTYPLCFAAMLFTNLLFWIFTMFLFCKGYEIDPDMLRSEAIKQAQRLE